MGSSLPPDPYAALGVPQDATAAAIKSVYRKLVLRCHPDKVSDPVAKETAVDEFHKIQTAYEILSDDDRRARYDAEVRLMGLRREAAQERMSSGARGRDSRPDPSPRSSYGPSARTASYNDRATPVYEERRPSYATADHFDSSPRATARKEPRDPDFERAARRSPTDSKEKLRAAARASKGGAWTSRKEKTKKKEKETRRERDRKYNAFAETDSDGDEEDRNHFAGVEDELRAKELYYGQMRRQREQAENGFFSDERVRKMFTQDSSARDYIQSRSRPTERRPSPQRTASNRDRMNYSERPPVGSRQSSSRPQTAGGDGTELPYRPAREDRRTSVDTTDASRRPAPPPFHSSKSSPADIRIPTDKPRSQSLRTDMDPVPPAHPPPPRRAETMPHKYTDNGVPKVSTKTEIHHGIPTPEATPTYDGPTSMKYHYGKQYADDIEIPTPDGYRTEVREPREASSATVRPSLPRRTTRSPSPAREPRETRDSRDKRSTSGRHGATLQAPPAPSRNVSYVHRYDYSDHRGGSSDPMLQHERERTRPTLPSRGSSARGGTLFGEIPRPEGPTLRPSTGSPRRTYSSYPVAPSDAPRNTREVRPEDYRMQAGHGGSRRTSVADRPSVSRSGSGNPVHVR